VPTTIGQVHATTGRVYATVGRVPATVDRVPLTVDRRREEIVVEYHTYLIPYRVKPHTSDMFHKWIGHVRWTLT
jgi:hypothetical protein